jgi:hypothetical protein
MLSMLPPVDREDELRSRSDYYLQYTRENFVAERDCLVATTNNSSSSSSNDIDDDDDSFFFDDRQVARFLFHLRKGEDHRTWLLHDMKFNTDPYSERFDTRRVDRLEERAAILFKTLQDLENGRHDDDDDDDDDVLSETTNGDMNVDHDDDDDDMFSDLDDEDSSDDEDNDNVRRLPHSKNQRNRT